MLHFLAQQVGSFYFTIIANCGGEWDDFCTTDASTCAGSYLLASFDLSANDLNNQYFGSITASDAKMKVYPSPLVIISVM